MRPYHRRSELTPRGVSVDDFFGAVSSSSRQLRADSMWSLHSVRVHFSHHPPPLNCPTYRLGTLLPLPHLPSLEPSLGEVPFLDAGLRWVRGAVTKHVFSSGVPLAEI
jgi:hypothetical protein